MMNHRIYTILFLLFSIATGGVAQTRLYEPNEPMPKDPTVITGKFSNGMQYYIRKNAKPEARAELRLAVKVGSVVEDPDQQGLAHFLEHLCFNGTKRFPKQDLVNFLESTGIRFGAHLNAYTSFDETVYMLQVPMDKPGVIEKGFDVLEDWASAIDFDDKEIDKERGVVVEEWRLRQGAGSRITDKLLPTILAGSQYAKRLPIGLKEVLDTFHYDAVKRFYRDWYRPDQMAVIAVGDFDPAKIEAMIRSRFEKLTNPTPLRPRTAYTIPAHSDMFVATATDKELPSAEVEIYFLREQKKVKTIGDNRNRLAAALYDAMLNARLDEITQKPDAPFISAQVSDGDFLGDRDMYHLSAGLKSESLAKGYETLLKEAFRVKEHGFTPTEFERQKKIMLNNIEKAYKEKDKTDSRVLVNQCLRNFLDDDPYPSMEARYEIAKKYIPLISLTEVNSLSEFRMRKTDRVITVAAPEKEGVRVPSEAELRNLLNRAETAQHAEYEDKITDIPLMPLRPKPGRITATKMKKEIGVTEWTLANGIKVIVKPTDFKNDEVIMAAYAPGGASLASNDNHVSAEASDDIMAQCGVSEFDRITLQKLLAGKSVGVAPMMEQLRHGFRGSASPKDLETMFQLIYLYATAPRKDSSAFSAYIAQIRTFLENRSNDPNSVFSDTVSVTLANGHYRARPWSMKLLGEMNLDKAYAFYKDRFSDMHKFTFVIVGNVDIKEIKPFVETYLATLPAGKRDEKWVDIKMYPPQGIVEKSVRKGVEPKSSARIVINGFMEYNEVNRFYLNSMAEVLAIKLRESLREDKGGVYGVGCRAIPSHYPEERYQLQVSFGCAPDRVDELVTEVTRLIDEMTTTAPSEEYVTKVKQIAKRELEVNLKENRFWLNYLYNTHYDGENPTDILKREALIETLTPEKVLETGRKYCNRANYIQVVLYPEK